MSAGSTPSFLDLLRLRVSGAACDASALSGAEGARRLALVDEMLGLLAEARAEPASARLRRAVCDIPRRARPPRSRSVELIARLVPAERGSGALAFRGSASAAPALFRAGDWEVDVSRTPRGAVVGQVLPADPAASAPDVRDGFGLLFGETSVLECELEPGGGFRFAGVEPGRCARVLEFAGVRIVVPDAVLGGGAT